MKNNYRINVRFDLRKEREKDAVEYLAKLSEQSGGTRNRFIVDVVIEAIRRQQSGTDISLEDIRTMFREELQSVSFVSDPATETPPFRTELTEEEKAKNDAGILSALAMFD
ncbi:MAG: hypothetical protein IJK33_09820 [Clostridia bacterium]|nr:hypothetical protein [Clostridia bacterium]